MEFVRKIYAFLVDTIQSILIAAAIFLIVYIFLFRPFQVNGESMYPNFHDRDYVLTNLIGLRFGTPRLGDVIVFKAPLDQERDFIKRVIGIPGDSVMIQDGDVYLNGEKLDESKYLKEDVKSYGGAFMKDGQAVIVPDGSYFVMGDNRPYSSDSREWGFVPKALIIGTSFFSYWPLSEFHLITNPYR